MLKNTIYIISLALSLSYLSSCSYSVAPTAAPAVNVYSSYDTKIQGRWALVIDEGTTEFNRVIKSSSYACSAHKYPLNSGDTISLSIKRTMANVFHEVIEMSTMPNISELSQDNISGVVIIRLDNFIARVRCDQGFWSTDCIADIDMAFGVEVRGNKGILFGTSVGDQKTSEGGAGSGCGNISNIIAEAYRLALRDSMERMAEKISNSERIRAYAMNRNK